MNSQAFDGDGGGPNLQTASPTILLVEESTDTRMMLKFLLELSGYNVLETVNGRQALEVARRARPQLILMDLGSNELDGLITTRAMRGDEKLQATPIIAINASGAAHNGEQAKAAGCDGYLTKPLDFEELSRLVRQHLSHNGGQAAVSGI